jgi:hypothetical protein
MVKAGEALKAKLDEVLNRDSHRWFLGKMNPAEKAKRKSQAAEFKKRYSK